MKKQIPVDFISMKCYFKESHSLFNLCSVGKTLFKKDTALQLPKVAKDKYPYDNVFTDIDAQNLCGNDLFTSLPVHGYSFLVLQCTYADQSLGFVSLGVKGENIYTEKHKELVRVLISPFTKVLCSEVINKNIYSYNSTTITAKTLKDMAIRDKRYTFPESKNDENTINEGCLHNLFESAKNVAKFSTSVLITGETGVGKEVFANYIHRNSTRNNEPFIKVNCGTIPENLIDNELFGHEKGAFTGADSTQKGRFELADKGTLFLDELAELPLNCQAKLLRVVQFGEFERLGGTKTIKVNVRIIAATNKDLIQMIEDGDFREDLYWRINVFPLKIPPIRERKKDIPDLITCLIMKICKRLEITEPPVISPDQMEKIIQYDWPGNVREMENFLEREIIQNFGSAQAIELKISDLDSTERHKQPDKNAACNKDMDNMMREHILKILEQTKWRISGTKGAASLLKMHPNTLRHRMKKLGLL
ncbi:sigma-54 interaction domain-containing protein [Denitrovibrio acetiphilus]|jgi:transcriptional regulator with GAF, ATPase, and Fis domain|nr:sigma 54-interacting transcriptional regulator [Denitrovibrio acetiphilus]